jgi:carbon-monoxide dehydrogenase small subunit
MLLAALTLLEENPDPSEEEIKLGMDGNLCRCTGYYNIVAAIRAAAAMLAAQHSPSPSAVPSPLAGEG